MENLHTGRVGLIQMRMAADCATNLARAVAHVEAAAGQGARVICLPELFLSPYFCQAEDPRCFDLAEPIPGPTTEVLGGVARRLGVVLVAPLFERRAAGVHHNSAAVLDADGALLGVYRKMHIPDDPGYYEKYYFAPGDLGFRIFDTRVGRLAVLICWDQWFPEAARLAALQGAQLIFYPTAIGWHPAEKAANGAAQRSAWQTVQRGQAIANGVYVAAVNRVGLEQPAAGGAGLEFWGSSFVCDPQGVVLAEAAADREEVLLAEVNGARVEEVRRHWPFLRDRRIDAYQGLAQRFLE
ncbi:MAG: carbon-nitrogen hydrolase [Kiritimatiellaeota bacterium]|nr:carbon-nitrogen hydrolase [Kiritimatiellota bacterium]